MCDKTFVAVYCYYSIHFTSCSIGFLSGKGKERGTEEGDRRVALKPSGNVLSIWSLVFSSDFFFNYERGYS